MRQASVRAGEPATGVRDLIREMRGAHDVKIMKRHVSRDHAHVGVDPISRLPRRLKGKTAHKIMLEFPHSKKHYWGQPMWARGYFCRGTGNETNEVIA